MARYTGHDLAIGWVHAGGTTWLEGDFRRLSTSEDQASADSTAGNDTYNQFIGTFANATGEVVLLDTSGTAGTAMWAAVAPNTAGTLWWYPTGTASGSISHYAPAFVSGRDREFPYDDVVSITVGYQFTSSPTAGTVA
jgi:hypothetical protein